MDNAVGETTGELSVAGAMEACGAWSSGSSGGLGPGTPDSMNASGERMPRKGWIRGPRARSPICLAFVFTGSAPGCLHHSGTTLVGQQ